MSTEARRRGSNDGSEADEVGERRSLKVKIPADYHRKLHSIKILTGKTISSAITEALSEYLDEADVDAASDADPA